MPRTDLYLVTAQVSAVLIVRLCLMIVEATTYLLGHIARLVVFYGHSGSIPSKETGLDVSSWEQYTRLGINSAVSPSRWPHPRPFRLAN